MPLFCRVIEETRQDGLCYCFRLGSGYGYGTQLVRARVRDMVRVSISVSYSKVCVYLEAQLLFRIRACYPFRLHSHFELTVYGEFI